MENTIKNEVKEKSVLEKLIYEHKMFIEKFYQAKNRLNSSTFSLGGTYKCQNDNGPQQINEENSCLDEYNYLLSIQKDILADIWFSIERLEELVSR
jgi:hypothetical protein